MKRIFALLLICCLLLPLRTVAQAAEDTLEQAIIDSCIYDQKVSIEDYELTEDQLEDLYYTMLYDGKLPWYASYEYEYYYNEYTGKILEFQPVLPEGYDRMAYEEAVAALLDACILEGMADWQKALAVYDHLALHSAYDETYTRDTGYDLLLEGSAVCSGYAALYQDLLLRLGIPCVQVDSEEMDHVWNLVQLDGSWYHVDVTWADPSPDVYGMVDHRYFLKTDDQLQNAEDPHYGWETDLVCDDETYANAFWTDIPSGIIFTDADTCYYLREDECVNRLYKRSISRDKETLLYQEKEDYINIGYGQYAYYHTGLTLRDGRLWLCDMKKALSLDLQGKGKQTEYTYDTKKNHRYLMGLWADDDKLYLTTGDHDGNGKTETVALTSTDAHRHEFVRTVTESTCSAPGYTTSVCSCGLTATGDPQAKLPHTWTELDHQDASLFGAGYTHNQCSVCDEKETQVLAQLSFGEVFKEYGIVLIAIVAIPISLLTNKHKWKK